MVPPAEALDVSVISYLIRNDSPYITNRYPVGRLPQFSRDGTIMDMGEEARNNRTFGEFGYGHVLFLNIPRAVEPVSTGLLSKDGKAPDFPTLSMLCQEARRIGGTTVWCHNGSGMEAPVAAALGHMDAYNMADGLEADYDRYYRLLNCGFRLPASSGTDWWITDHNRVFVQVQGEFTYDTWIAGLRAGRTFVSNGPLLELRVNDKGPGRIARNERAAANFRDCHFAFALRAHPDCLQRGDRRGAFVAQPAGGKARGGDCRRPGRLDRGARRRAEARRTPAIRSLRIPVPFMCGCRGHLTARPKSAGAFVDEIEESDAVHSQELSLREGCRPGAGAGTL